MATAEHLTRAPIIEAVIDLLFDPGQRPSMADVRDAMQSIQTEYPSQLDRKLVNISWLVPTPEEVLATGSTSEDAILARSADGLQGVQCRLDGFSFHRLHPYENWDRLAADAMAVWRACQDKLQRPSVVEVSVSFLNRLSWPKATGIQEWLAIYPQMPTSLVARRGEFVLSSELEFPIGTGRLNMFTAEGDGSETVVMLEARGEYRGAALQSEGDLAQVLAGLREIKNTLFFSAITDQMLRRLQQ